MSVQTGEDVLRTLLGSCVGVALHDRRRMVGGLAHVVLPDSRGNRDRPGKFVDTAIPELIRQMEAAANSKLNLVAILAGGASMFAKARTAGIGSQNVHACQRWLGELKIPVIASHCGGEQGRRMTLRVGTGQVIIEIVGQDPIYLQ